ncbi:hypothetical protein [Pseudoruegeria sp. HB172150]|uniref:hypothetical protein n=1 Tax=Pseudoruegeria sp. HB172150 TaxID=2721164 RepID=UPI001555745F|nr:hypothetical protein [Pseudoruegeria sp. HB172150]
MKRLLDTVRRRPGPPALPSHPTEGELKEAARFPGGYIYRLGQGADPTNYPMAAVIGWWTVDAKGEIHAPFEPNAEYDPIRWPPRAR